MIDAYHLQKAALPAVAATGGGMVVGVRLPPLVRVLVLVVGGRREDIIRISAMASINTTSGHATPMRMGGGEAD